MNSAASSSNTNGDSPLPVIFVVDDEPMLLELNSVIIEPLGYHVRTFRDPGTAVRAFQLSDPYPVLIVTDYAMHNMNGLDLINACRLVNPRQKILLVSGTVDESIYRHAKEKPNRFLPKPYRSRQLADLVEELLAE